MLEYLKNKKRLFAFLLVAIAIYWGFLWIHAGAPQIIVENNSGQAMTAGTVTFGKVPHDIGSLAAGKSCAVDVPNREEAMLELRAVLANGARSHFMGRQTVHMRWVQGGLDAKLHVIIGTNGQVTIK